MNETVTAPKGFLACGTTCGIKVSGNKDLGLIVCPTGAKAAAVFTTNNVVSAAVTVCREHLASKEVSAVVVNSGNANTCTGPQGLKNAKKMCETLAQEIDSDPEQILIASTGIIGHQLPINIIVPGIKNSVAMLKADRESGFDFATAIMTTDNVQKQAVRNFKIGTREVIIAGTTKGAGMIAPNMATTLCFITTDVNISKSLLQKALKTAIGESLNKLTVDGHQSTNDTAILLASGLAGNPQIKKQDADFNKFVKVLCDLCSDLAKQMALDAEGATRMFTVVIEGAATKSDAAKAARAVADYDLVKCAIHGGDPNWGRIICAVGSCGVKINQNKLTCKLDNITVFKNGKPADFDRAKASEVTKQKQHTIKVNLGVGKESDFCYGCDLGRDYVTINADYHT